MKNKPVNIYPIKKNVDCSNNYDPKPFKTKQDNK